jgi:hypothetical protein
MPVRCVFLDREIASIESPTLEQASMVVQEFDVDDISGGTFDETLATLEDE